MRTAIWSKRLMRAFMFTQITAVCTREVAEAAFMGFLSLVEGRDVCLQLRVGGGGVAAAVADIGSFAGVGALVVVFGLVGCKGLGAGGIAAGVGAVAGVPEEVARELGALLEVFGGGVARVPLAEA
jgi:hypothetical protein